MTGAIDPVALAAELIRRPSVTPEDAGALDVLEGALAPLGFVCHRLPFGEGAARVENLYARLGAGSPVFCFAGHTDVVPPGERAAWRVDPFAGAVADDRLFGRGATDMKGAVAAFAAAVARHLGERGAPRGSIALLITGDEEGPAVNGTRKVLDWMAARGERIDACLVGEPTCRQVLGDTIKIGRRGTITGRLVVEGAQGHVAYPKNADNPIPRMVRALAALAEARLDDGTEHFQPSNLEITTVDVGNPAANVIPATARATFNIRFNDRHTGESLARWLRETCAAHAGTHRLDIEIGGECFLTPPGPLTDLVAAAVEGVTGRRPELSTSGGTSDARFIKDHCPVVEFGLPGPSMHKIDEHVALADLEALTRIYRAVLDAYFAA